MSDDLTAVYLLGAYNASKEWRDAAEFEARVAAKLSALVAWAYDDGWSDRLNVREYQPQNWADVLKEARLAVEEEMDG